MRASQKPNAGTILRGDSMNQAEVTKGLILILPSLDHPKFSCASPGRLYTKELTLAGVSNLQSLVPKANALFIRLRADEISPTAHERSLQEIM